MTARTVVQSNDGKVKFRRTLGIRLHLYSSAVDFASNISSFCRALGSRCVTPCDPLPEQGAFFAVLEHCLRTHAKHALPLDG